MPPLRRGRWAPHRAPVEPRRPGRPYIVPKYKNLIVTVVPYKPLQRKLADQLLTAAESTAEILICRRQQACDAGHDSTPYSAAIRATPEGRVYTVYRWRPVRRHADYRALNGHPAATPPAPSFLGFYLAPRRPPGSSLPPNVGLLTGNILLCIATVHVTSVRVSLSALRRPRPDRRCRTVLQFFCGLHPVHGQGVRPERVRTEPPLPAVRCRHRRRRRARVTDVVGNAGHTSTCLPERPCMRCAWYVAGVRCRRRTTSNACTIRRRCEAGSCVHARRTYHPHFVLSVSRCYQTASLLPRPQFARTAAIQKEMTRVAEGRPADHGHGHGGGH
eukprot:COSAG01_NODE_211_length_21847_cov_17.992781_4_plen_331_part_00